MPNEFPAYLDDALHSGDNRKLRLIDGVYRVVAVLGFFPVATAVYLTISRREYFSCGIFLSMYLLCVILSVGQRDSYRFRALLLILMLFGVGSMELYNGSMAADGSLYLFACVIVTGVLFGQRWGFLVVFLAFAMFGVAAIRWLADPENLPVDLNSMPTSPIVWLAASLNFLLIVAVFMSAVASVLRRLESSLAASEELVERLRAEIEGRESIEGQLRQSQRMKVVGQFAGGVAHDFNNLLQVILGYGEMALEKTDPDSSVSGYLGQMLGAGERARDLVRQLLAFSRRQVLEMRSLDLNVVVLELSNMIRRVIGEDISLEVSSGAKLGPILGDRGQIEQILMNLCVNARDAIESGGTITIETSRVALDDGFCAVNTWAKPGAYTVLRVVDTGRGMSEETLQHMFEPFFTSKGPGEGTGLGLSTVFGIVHQHSGLMNVRSKEGEGTEFSIYFAESELDPIEEALGDSKVVRGGAETLLVVDDDPQVLNVAEAILTQAGYKVLVAHDGEEALRVFDAHIEEVELVMLDLIMPNMGGRVAAGHILGRCPDIPILFCSGYSGDLEQPDGPPDTGLRLLKKPYHRDDLLRTVREVLGSRQSHGRRCSI